MFKPNVTLAYPPPFNLSNEAILQERRLQVLPGGVSGWGVRGVRTAWLDHYTVNYAELAYTQLDNSWCSAS